MARPRRHVVVTLLPEEWDRLVQDARLADRDPYQQARWLLVRALPAGVGPAPLPDEPPSEAESAVA